MIDASCHFFCFFNIVARLFFSFFFFGLDWWIVSGEIGVVLDCVDSSVGRQVDC